MAMRQLSMFPAEETTRDTSTTFTANLLLPVHRWFRYSAGFSAHWVQEVLGEHRQSSMVHVLDPFAGSGTVLIESEKAHCASIGVEAHPFVARVARAKLLWQQDARDFAHYGMKILVDAHLTKGEISQAPTLMTKCFPAQTLAKLVALRQAWAAKADGSPLSELTWLALVSILRECSPVGTAQWQYVLPNKSKANALDPYEAFQVKIHLMQKDMRHRQQSASGVAARLFEEDAQTCASVPDGWADLIITSPPYANNYDYADATRLETTFLGETRDWGDLQAVVRQRLVPSCTQHVAKHVKDTDRLIADPLLAPIHDELAEVCAQLDLARATHGGKKPYHTMIAAYFSSLARVWLALRRVTHADSQVCFVIGDSAPYGVYVPVDRWLGTLALSAGFSSFTFEKTRDRNTKWKNRKHTVPLQEGRLWVRG